MKISSEKLRELCEQRGVTLNRLLKQAGVSKNAYYSLARKATILPSSIMKISERLDVSPSSFLVETTPEETRVKVLLDGLERIMRRNRRADRDNVRHTLLLLQEKPIERLRRALIRGRQLDLHE